MQTGSFGTLIGWKSDQTTYVPLWNRMEGVWLWALRCTRAHNLENLVDGHNWFLNQLDSSKISCIVCLLSLSAKSGVYLSHLRSADYDLRLRTQNLKSIVEGHNWFLNHFVEIPRRPIIVSFLYLSAKAGLKPLTI
jgi:hypothetical protein